MPAFLSNTKQQIAYSHAQSAFMKFSARISPKSTGQDTSIILLHPLSRVNSQSGNYRSIHIHSWNFCFYLVMRFFILIIVHILSLPHMQNYHDFPYSVSYKKQRRISVPPPCLSPFVFALARHLPYLVAGQMALQTQPHIWAVAVVIMPKRFCLRCAAAHFTYNQPLAQLCFLR